MIDFLLPLILEKSVPVSLFLISAALWFIYTEIRALRKSGEATAAALVAQVTAINSLATGVGETSKTVAAFVAMINDVIRMMERFQSAEGERHSSNVVTLQSIVGTLQNILGRIGK